MFLFLQPIADTSHIALPVIPSGFDWLYVPIFVVGMLAHFIVAMKNVSGGWNKIPWGTMFAALITWFFTDKRYTLIAGSVAAILGLGSAYGLNVGFATLNGLAVAIALAAGYIGDSAFNKAAKIQSPPANP